jgi:integral membrane sensor domain MASE1
MNGLEWTMLILAAMIGATLFAAIGLVLLTLLLGDVSERLAQTDEAHRDS